MRYVAILTAVGLAGCAGCAEPAGTPGRPPAVTPAPKKPTEYDRAEFRALVMGKTPDEVIEAVGRPTRTQNTPVCDFWYYDGILDPISGKRGRAQVRINGTDDGNRVTDVNFY
jgi:hypothetical protein